MTEPVEPPTERLLAGRYRLGDLLGSGGMADVYRATDLRLGRDVAIKLFRDGVDPQQRRRLTDEANLLARLSCPGLITIYDIGTDDTSPYLVMQLIDGTTLRDRLITDPLGEAAMCRLGAQLASALGSVHEQGIVHRDVKPSNVLLDGRGRPWLADFGISLLAGSTRLTATGHLIGTAGYLAPEQVLGQQVGPAADVYALGLVLLECLTGMPEYDGTDIEVAVARLHRQPRIPAGLSAPVASLLATMTSATPGERPSAAECAAALQTASNAQENTVAVAPGPWAAAGGAAAPGAGVALAAGAGIAGAGLAGAGVVGAGIAGAAAHLQQGPATQELPAVPAAGPSTRQFDGPLVPPAGPLDSPDAPIERQFTKRTSLAAAAGLLAVAAVSWGLLSATGDPQPVRQAVPPAAPISTAPPTTESVPAETQSSVAPAPPPPATQPPAPGKKKDKGHKPDHNPGGDNQD